jgi:hypothetical protein
MYVLLFWKCIDRNGPIITKANISEEIRHDVQAGLDEAEKGGAVGLRLCYLINSILATRP